MSKDQLRAAATGQAPQPPKTIFSYLDDPRVKAGIAAVAGKYLTPERMLRLCVMAVKKTPKLAQCDPQTVLGAMMTSAALGLEPNTVQQQAFLMPYNTRRKVGNEWVDHLECQFQIGYRGFLTLMHRSPLIGSCQAEAIHEADRFEHELGSKTFLTYSKKLAERGPLIGAFSWVQYADGGESACVLPVQEIHKIRERSETYRALRGKVEAAEDGSSDWKKAMAKLMDTPWVMWEDDMAVKSAIKKHAKLLPVAVNDALAAAAGIDDRSDGGGLDLRSMVDVETVRAVVSDGSEPPALEDHSDEQQQSREGFGATQQRREPAPAEPAQTPAATPAAAKRTTRAAAPAASPSQAPAAGDAPAPTYAQLADDLQKCRDRDAGLEVLDLARGLPDDQMRDLRAVFSRKFPE